tara:strand:- start:4051 stop:6804 length:2754 start_codon:yes stop_codon:yes gene_type:complete
MLVKLSSDNQTDPTKFANNFSEGMVIKPFSKIALLKSQITRVNTGKKLLINAGTILNVRFTPYDVIRLTLNPGADTTYTIEEFCEYVHTLLPDNTAWNRGGQFVDVSAFRTNETDLEWRFYWLGISDNYELFMYGNEYYKRTYLTTVLGNAMPTTSPGNLGVGNNQTNIGSATGNYACGIGWDLNKYTPPPNQANCFAHNMLISGQGETRTTFVIGQPDLKGFKVILGKATADTATNYTDAPLVGTPAYANPGQDVGDFITAFNFKDDGKLDVDYFNWETNDKTRVVGADPYQPGDIYDFHGMGTIAVAEDPRRYFYLVCNRRRSNGLAYWIPGKTTLTAGDTVMTLNDATGVADNVSLDKFYMTHINRDLAANDLRFLQLAMERLWKATGFRYTCGYGEDVSGEAQATSVDKAAGGGELISNGVNEVVKGHTGDPKAWCNDAFLLERWTAAAVPGAQSDKNAVCRLATDGIPLDTPFYIGFYIRPDDDTAKLAGGTNSMTILGSDANFATAVDDRLVKISIAQAEAWDLAFYEQDGTVRQLTLLDGGATRISIALGTNYHFSMCYMGTQIGTNKGQIIFRMLDIDAGVEYNNVAAATSIGATGLPPLAYHGGIKPTITANFAKWSCAYYADFRLYQKNTDLTQPITLWDNVHAALENYWTSGVKTNDWYWGGELLNETILPSGYMTGGDNNIDDKYVVCGLPRSDTTISQFFQRDTAAVPTDINWFDAINIYCPGSTHLPNGSRLTTLDAGAYAGNEGGLVEVDDIMDELVFIDPTRDADENVLQTRTAAILGDGVGNPYIQLDCGLNDVLLDRETINVEITNLPHRTYNGTNGSVDKTIYQMPLVADKEIKDNLEVLEVIPPTKVWVELNNAGDIPLNRLEVQLSDTNGVKLDNKIYQQPTNIVVEIKNKNEIIN